MYSGAQLNYTRSTDLSVNLFHQQQEGSPALSQKNPIEIAEPDVNGAFCARAHEQPRAGI